MVQLENPNKQKLIALAQVEHGRYIKDNIEIILNHMDNFDPSTFRRTIDKILEIDLSVEVRNKLNRKLDYDDSALWSQVNHLSTNKVGRDEIINYRRKDISIAFEDLSPELAQKIEDAYTGAVYDDTEIRYAIDYLTKNKSNREELNDYRHLSNKIDFIDLTDGIIQKLNMIAPAYNDSDLRQRITNITKDISTINGRISIVESYAPIINRLQNDLGQANLNITELQTRSTGFDTKISEINVNLETKATILELNNYRRKSIKIAEDDLSSEVVNKLNYKYDDSGVKGLISGLSTQLSEMDKIINKKANISDLANYIHKSEMITERQLTQEIRDKLNGITEGNAYDDTELRNKITELENSKVGRTEFTELENTLVNYRLKSVKLDLNDFTDTIKSNLVFLDDFIKNGGSGESQPPYVHPDTHSADMITETSDKKFVNSVEKIFLSSADNRIDTLEEDVIGLETTKANITVLENYRSNDVKIDEIDLTDEVKAKLNATDSPTYDDTEVKADIQQLQTDVTSLESDKADKTQLVDYRLKSTEIVEADLSQAVKDKLNATDGGFPAYDDTEVRNLIDGLESDKADKTQLVDYRPVVTKIDEVDLSEAVKTKLNSPSESYDDTEVRNLIDGLESDKADKTQLANYRLSTTKISETDLSDEAKAKLNYTYDDTQVKADIDVKADKTQLSNYRLTATKLDEVDLSEAVKTKLNSTYDDTEIKTDLETKADKSELSNYRNITTKIDTPDLSPAVVQKLNNTELTATVESLNNSKADKTQLDSYRLKVTKIARVDLDTTLTNKIDSIFTDHEQLTNQNGNTNYLHVTNSEKVKYDGYDEKINTLFDVITSLEGQLSNALDRITVLESNPLDPVPVLTQSTLNGKNDIAINITSVDYAVSGTNVTVFDASKITCNIVGVIGTPTISGGKLVIPIIKALNYNTPYTITVAVGAIKNGSTANTAGMVTTFTTTAPPAAPTLTQSTLNGRSDVPINTTVVEYAVTGSGVTVADASKITCSISGVMGVPTISSGKLVIPIIKTLDHSTQYTFAIAPGAITNGPTANSQSLSTAFTTVAPPEPVITQADINGKTDVLVTTEKVEYSVTGINVSIADVSKITCDIVGAIGTPAMQSGKLIIPLNHPLAYATVYTITIASGALKNVETLSTSSTVTTFTTQEDPATDDNIVWEYKFVQPEVNANWYGNKDPKWGETGYIITDEEVYGPNLDGIGAVTELYSMGTNLGPELAPQRLPKEGFEDFTMDDTPSMHGGWSCDTSFPQIAFSGGAMSDWRFKIVKHKRPIK